MDPETTFPSPRRARRGARLRRLTASTTAGGMMLVGLPFALEYVVRPGDTLWQIADEHDTTVSRLVRRNDLHRSGDRIYSGQTLRIPGDRDDRARRATRGGAATAGPHRSSRIDPDKRRIVHYTVRPGDTPSGLAVRFHAWTAELIAMNGPVLRVGERIRIPVVVAAAAKDRRRDRARAGESHRSSHRKGSTRPRREPAARRPARRGSRPDRATVRRVISRSARRHGVDRNLALAVSWQESGWQQHVRSSANAIGAMQVLPSTGRWMSLVVGRRLHLRDLHDNVTAGVVLLKILDQQTRKDRTAVAGYYQGLAGVRRHGMYRSTKRYVANVLALERRFERGRYPA